MDFTLNSVTSTCANRPIDVFLSQFFHTNDDASFNQWTRAIRFDIINQNFANQFF